MGAITTRYWDVLLLAYKAAFPRKKLSDSTTSPSLSRMIDIIEDKVLIIQTNFDYEDKVLLHNNLQDLLLIVHMGEELLDSLLLNPVFATATPPPRYPSYTMLSRAGHLHCPFLQL